MKGLTRCAKVRLALAAIARITGVSSAMAPNVCQPGILSNGYAGRSHPKKTGKLTIQLDELWSFVCFKANKQWVWLAMDVYTREIVGVYVGNRTRSAAKKLWQLLPAVYR